MSEQPGQPAAVPAGEPVTIQPADGDTNYTEQGDGTMVQDQGGDEGDNAQGDGSVPGAVTPPAGGPGEQSLAERQAGGEQAAADVPQPEAGPGGSSPYAQPAPSYPAEAVSDEAGNQGTVPVGNATSNESPKLPGNLTSGAARAHAALSTASDVQGNGDMSESERLSALGAIIDFAMRELDRFLPAHVRQPAADEVNREL